MNIPGSSADFTRSDNLGSLDVVDGENEKPQPLSLSTLSLGETERDCQPESRDGVEQVDELAATKDHDIDQHESNTDVKTVNVTDETVLEPPRLTLYYPNETPDSISHFLSKTCLLTVSVNDHVPIGRHKHVKPHIFLNSDTMSRFYGQIRMDVSHCFWLKNVSEKKIIEILYSKGKKRQSRLLKPDDEAEIKTNHIVKFHTLEFKVLIGIGDLACMNYDLVLKREPEPIPRNNGPSHQVIYNQGQISRLYMNGESHENNSGPVVNRTRVNSGGPAIDSGLAVSFRAPVHTPLTPGYGPPPIAAGNGYHQMSPFSPRFTGPFVEFPASGSSNGYPQNQHNWYHNNSGHGFAPQMHGHFPQYQHGASGPQYVFPWNQVHNPQAVTPGVFGLQPPPYYPPTYGGGLNQLGTTDAPKPVPASNGLQDKIPQYFQFPYPELINGRSQQSHPQSQIGNSQGQGHVAQADRRPVENSEDPDPVARLMQKVKYSRQQDYNQ